MFVFRFDAKLSNRSITTYKTIPSLLFGVNTRCTIRCADRVCTDGAMQEKGAGYRRLEEWVLVNVNSPSPLPWPSTVQLLVPRRAIIPIYALICLCPRRIPP